MRGSRALEEELDRVRSVSRVDHFEINVGAAARAKMLRPSLRVARAAHALFQGSVDSTERGIDQTLAKLFGKSRVVVEQKKNPSPAPQRHPLQAHHPPVHCEPPRSASARRKAALTSWGTIRRMHSRPIGH